MTEADGRARGRAKGDRVEVARAKGRPMLSWVGKRPLREVHAFPSQPVERFAPGTPDGIATGFRGKVDLVYIDPPFDSGADSVGKVRLRGASGSARLDGETYTLGEQIQYTDIWGERHVPPVHVRAAAHHQGADVNLRITVASLRVESKPSAADVA